MSGLCVCWNFTVWISEMLYFILGPKWVYSVTLIAATGRFFSYFLEEVKFKESSMYLWLDSLVGDHPHCLQCKCASHGSLGTTSYFVFWMCSISFLKTHWIIAEILGSLFLKVFLCLSTLSWGRDGNMLWYSFLKIICTLSNPVSPILKNCSLWIV